MSKLYCIGELLIDFQSVGTGSIKDTAQFVKKAGGAPANVCVQAVKLGAEAAYLTKVGNDSVEVRLPVERVRYAGDRYEAWVSGYRPSLDSVKKA